MRLVSYTSCMHCDADLTKEGTKRRRCAGCHSVFYDNVTCQKKDWAIHKTECKELQSRFIAAAQFRCPEVDTMAKLLARPDACAIIAQCYYEGEGGFEKNRGLGIFWATQWVKGGELEAMYFLGMLYTSDVPNRFKEGVKLLMSACRSSPWSKMAAEAQVRLGTCYTNGRGVARDYKEAVKWFRLSAEGGNARAHILLAFFLSRGIGVEKDKEEALIWIRKAAEQGHAEGQFMLGDYLRSERAEAEAAKWYRRAAEQGFGKAECALGTCLMDGLGVAKDPTEAVFWYRKSADQGFAMAQYQLGECYLSGFGLTVGVDKQEAAKWYHTTAVSLV